MFHAVLLMAVGFIPEQGVRASEPESETGSVPIVYTTDLYQPPDDPDDHFDLATLFAIQEFDIRGIVFDLGKRGANRPGLSAV